MTRVVAVAGRRIDAPNVEVARFPATAEARVKAELVQQLGSNAVRTLVASAASGADILALEAAGALGVRTRIILPFDRARFRATSVTDRDPAWGERYDSVLRVADVRGDVIVLPALAGGDDAAYARVTASLIAESQALAKQFGDAPLALAVWDENPRPSGDASKDFMDLARAAGLDVITIRTLP